MICKNCGKEIYLRTAIAIDKWAHKSDSSLYCCPALIDSKKAEPKIDNSSWKPIEVSIYHNNSTCGIDGRFFTCRDCSTNVYVKRGIVVCSCGTRYRIDSKHILESVPCFSGQIEKEIKSEQKIEWEGKRGACKNCGAEIYYHDSAWVHFWQGRFIITCGFGNDDKAEPIDDPPAQKENCRIGRAGEDLKKNRLVYVDNGLAWDCDYTSSHKSKEREDVERSLKGNIAAQREFSGIMADKQSTSVAGNKVREDRVNGQCMFTEITVKGEKDMYTFKVKDHKDIDLPRISAENKDAEVLLVTGFNNEYSYLLINKEFLTKYKYLGTLYGTCIEPDWGWNTASPNMNPNKPIPYHKRELIKTTGIPQIIEEIRAAKKSLKRDDRKVITVKTLDIEV